MKVSISNTIEVTDEQREALARVLDGEGSRKRKATRDEFRKFIWAEGNQWAEALTELCRPPTRTRTRTCWEPSEADEDLI